MKVLVVDVGGTHIKVGLGGRQRPLVLDSGPEMTAARMARAVRQATAGWKYDAVSIGYPGPVLNGQPAREPKNLGAGWVRFDYERALHKPVRIVNDAAMQALGSYQGGRMLFLGLGTGLGSALVAGGVVEPLELAHLPYRKGRSFEDYVGQRGLKRLGRKRWQRHVETVVGMLQEALQADYVMLGGGNSRKLDRLPSGARLGSNARALLGGQRLWEPSGVRGPRLAPARSRRGRRKSR